MTFVLTHGCIMGGVVTTPDLDAALLDYQGTLGLTLVELGTLTQDLADSWGCPGSANRRMATLKPISGAQCFIRLVEQPIPDGFKPTTTFGWASYEITVQNVFGWEQAVAGTGFRIVGPPKEIPSMPFFVPMQMLGRGEEMIYLNEVRQDMPNTDLPHANSPVDHIFIVILATPDRAKSVAWYRDALALDEVDTFTLEYTMINKAFGLPDGTTSALTMMQKGRMPIVEVDDYPPQATPRQSLAGCLPPGNALVTLGVKSLDEVKADFIAPPALRGEALYGGRRTASAKGFAEEIVELVEIG
jgi:catechol 2,3-dioxygenase-like lactoylglutathione lyase family enzyme